jgi:hypothetical protein
MPKTALDNQLADNSMNFLNSPTHDTLYMADQLNNTLCLQKEEWERILSSSGGKLELPKCLAYIVVYDWSKGKPLQWPQSEILTQLLVCNTETQQQTCILIIDPAKSHKILGTFQNPTSNPDQQEKALQ